MNFQYETEIEFQDESCSAILNVVVDHFSSVKGSYSWNADSDMDYYGYDELEFTIKSIVVEKENGNSFYTNSKTVINEIVVDNLYKTVYDWILEQLKNQDNDDNF